MATPVISISSESSDESVGSVLPRVILFGTILIEIHVVPADLPVALEVTGNSCRFTCRAPMASPFLCLDDSESEPAVVSSERHVSFDAHDAMIGGWGSKVMF
nr:hypothetical protein [Tanacetum cinerariifolium]